ncbi:MAG: hypothetical protein V3U87_10240 [Methylococcaceae bacterium]
MQPSDDVFTVRVDGISGAGELSIEGTVLIPGGISLRNQIQSINMNEGKGGVLAENAFDEYLFKGAKNSPIIIRTQSIKGALNYSVKAFDSVGTQIESVNIFFNAGVNEIPITSDRDGESTTTLIKRGLNST